MQERLASDKVIFPFVSPEENKVLWIRFQVSNVLSFFFVVC